MAYTPPPAVVVSGGVIAAGTDNTFRTNVLELHAAVELIRHRDTRSSISFPIGANAIVPNGTDEDVGDIALAAGVYTVGTPGTYALTVSIDPTTAFGTTSTVTIAAGGTQQILVLPNTGTQAAASFVKYLAASDTVTFSWNNNSGGAITATAATEVVLVSMPPAP